MRFQNLTRSVDIGGHAYLIESEGSRLVLDAGMHPKYEGDDALPNFSPLDFDSVSDIIISHAHLDHCGALPVLCRQQPGAEIHMTQETRALVEAMLHNSVNVMCAQREEKGLLEYPFFTHKQIDRLEPTWNSQPFERSFPSRDGGFRLALHPAGHVLGAAGVMIEADGHRLFYTGDVHFEDQTLSRKADFPRTGIDTLVIETTRGDTPRQPGYSRAAEIGRLADHINAALERGGSVLIPVFAMGKTQELLLTLHELKEEGRIPNAPIHIGGLSTKMSLIFDRFSGTSRRHFEGFRILEDMELVVASRRRGGHIPQSPGRIYALSSGMMSENTVSNRFARDFLPDERNAVLFVGYAEPSTPGGHILAADRGDEILLHPDEAPVPLEAEVERFDFSGHAPRDQILEYIVEVDPGRVLLVHGDPAARQWFADTLKERLPGTEVHIPQPGESIPLA